MNCRLAKSRELARLLAEDRGLGYHSARAAKSRGEPLIARENQGPMTSAYPR